MCSIRKHDIEIATLESEGGNPSLYCGMPHPKERPFSPLILRHEGTNNILLMFWYFEGQAKLRHLMKWMSVQPDNQAKRQCKDFNVAMFLVRGVVCTCIAPENIFNTLMEGIGKSWGRRESQQGP